MPVLRLFAAAREAAGEARVEFDGPTVGDVLDQARSRYGDAFASVLERSRVWVNGQPAELDVLLSAHDVVAVLPPVSGGAGGQAEAETPLPAPPEPAPPAPSFGFGTDLGDLPDFPPLPDIDIPSGTTSAGSRTHDAKFEALPAADQSSADDLLDRLAGLPLFPAGDPVFGEPEDRGREPLFPEPAEAAAPPEPAVAPEPVPPPEPPLPDDVDRSGWDPGRGLSWSVGDPTPPPPRRAPGSGADPERDLWSWPEPPDDEDAGEEPGSPSPFAPPRPSDWDRRVDPPAGDAKSTQSPPEDRSERSEPGDSPHPEGRSGDVPRSEGRSSDVPRSEGRSGDVPRSEGRSGDVPRSEGRSGDVPRSEGRSGDVPRSEGRSGDVPRAGGGPAGPDSGPPTAAMSIGIVDEPAVRILGPDRVARPVTTTVGHADEPAVRIIGAPPRPVIGEPARPNGYAAESAPPRSGATTDADRAASRAHAVGVLVDGPDALLSNFRMPAPGGDGGGATVTALATAPAPTAATPEAGPAAGAAAPAADAAPAPAPAPAKVKAKPPPLAVISKANRPHGRLGFLWAAITVGAVVAGPQFAGGWLAACAAVAGLQTAKVWRARGERPVQPLAAAIAAALPLCAISGARAMTAAIVGAIVVTFLARLFSLTKAPARDVGLTLAIGLMVGLAVASVVLLRNVNVQAPLLLLAFTAVYDAGAYVVGTGASSAWEGPAAGVLTVIPMTMLAAVILVPPFPEGSPLVLGLVAGALVPCGPLAGSALLGERDANAPALRRLDSLLVVGPLWAWCAAAFLG